MGDGKNNNDSVRGSAYNGGPGWPDHLSKNFEFLIMIEAQYNTWNTQA